MRGLQPVVISAPLTNRPLNVFEGHVLVSSAARQLSKFSIGGEAQPDDLAQPEPRIEKFPGKHVMAKIFFGADCTVLRFERKNPREETEEQQCERKDGDQ